MANATVFQTFQIGDETTPGTAVTADKRILTMGCDISLVAQTKVVRPRGQKYATAAGVNTRWAMAKLAGDLDLNAITYILQGGIKSVSATGTAAPYTWGSFLSDPDGEDTVKTFSVQVGRTLGIWKMAYGLVTGFRLSFDENGGQVAANMVGTAIEDVLLTPSGVMDTATNLGILLNLVHHNTLELSPTYGSLAASEVGYRRFEFGLEDHKRPAFFVKGSRDFSDTVEPGPKNQVQLTIEKNATSAGYMTQFEAGSTMFYKHISTDGVNSLTILGAALVEKIEEGNEDGIAVLKFDMQGQRHTSIGGGNGYPFKIDLINGINAI